MKLLRVALTGLACALPAFCLAQWQWMDKSGRQVFSDQAPPMDIPARSILRQPGVKPQSAAEAPDSAASAPPQPARATAPAPRLSGKEKDLEDRKKQVASAEADKKKAQDDERERIRADNCDRAKRSKIALDSGVRISRINDKGEPEILDDTTRAAEARRTNAVIASECQAGS